MSESMVERDLLSALKSASSWLERWAEHVGACRGGEYCTCGLTAIRSEAELAIEMAIALGDDD